MIYFFPKPYPDELLYSILARFAKICFENNPQGLNKTLFNYQRLRATIDLPGFIEQLSQKTFHLLGLDASQIINLHTLLPFYRCIIAENVADNIENLMKSNYAGDIHSKTGINTSSLSRSRFPKYCKQCVNTELEKNGEAYWHRAHQLPGIIICPTHFCFLETLYSNDHLTYISPFEHKVDSEIRYADQDLLKMVSLKLFDNLLSPKYIRNVDYKSRLINAGYTRGRHIDTRKTMENFEKYFGSKPLLAISREIGPSRNWITEIVRNPEKTFNPVRHILMDLFTNDLSKINYPQENHPFGKGPWICINKASDHYLKPVVISLCYHTDKKSKRLIGVFKCNCGMEYTKSYLTKKKGLVENIRVKTWGNMWEEQLKQELRTNASLREIARRLGTDAKTIGKYKNPEKKLTNQKNMNLSINEYRKQWVEHFRKHPQHGTTDGKQLLKLVYAFLYRNDRPWLLEFNLKHRKLSSNQLKLRLDWTEIDMNIYRYLKEAFQLLLKANHKGRITRTLLAKTIREESKLVAKNTLKLPLSSKFLTDNCESIKDYQERRIKNTVTLLRINRKPLKEWRITRTSGLKHPINPNHKTFIKNLLK